MAKKQSQKKRPQKQKIEWRRVFVAGLAVVMALLLLLPMISMIAGGVGAVTQSEIDALKEEQRESQVKQQELKNQLADVKEDQAAPTAAVGGNQCRAGQHQRADLLL